MLSTTEAYGKLVSFDGDKSYAQLKAFFDCVEAIAAMLVWDNSGWMYLHGGDNGCYHNVVASPGGGCHCTKCPAWFCY